MRNFKAPDPPKHLSTEAKRWWRNIAGEYEITDQAGILVLQAALEAFDRMRQAQNVIAKQGPTVTDRFNQVRVHPLVTVERDARAAMLAALKALNLDLEPLKDGPGRPGGQ